MVKSFDWCVETFLWEDVTLSDLVHRRRVNDVLLENYYKLKIADQLLQRNFTLWPEGAEL